MAEKEGWEMVVAEQRDTVSNDLPALLAEQLRVNEPPAILLIIANDQTPTQRETIGEIEREVMIKSEALALDIYTYPHFTPQELPSATYLDPDEIKDIAGRWRSYFESSILPLITQSGRKAYLVIDATYLASFVLAGGYGRLGYFVTTWVWAERMLNKLSYLIVSYDGLCVNIPLSP